MLHFSIWLKKLVVGPTLPLDSLIDQGLLVQKGIFTNLGVKSILVSSQLDLPVTDGDNAEIDLS
jgi:hypothetical protein